MDKFDDVGVDGGLTAREHDHFGVAFGSDEGVECRLHMRQSEREAVRLMARVSEAHRTVEIACGVHLDDPQAGVLLMIGTQTTVERAAALYGGLGLEGDRARLVEPQGVEIQLGVGVQQRLEAPVLPAALPQEHLVLPHVYPGVHDHLADRTDALGVFDEHLGPVDLLARKVRVRHVAPLDRGWPWRDDQPLGFHERCARNPV